MKIVGNNVLSNFSVRTVAIREYEKHLWSNYHVVHVTCDETQCNLVGGRPWTAWCSNPSRGKISHTLPGQSQNPPSILYSGYRVSFLGVNRLGRDAVHQPLSSAEVVYG